MLKAVFRGSNYEIGFKHGKLFKNFIIDSYKNHCNFAMANEIVNKVLNDIDEKMNTFFPETVEELKGLSHGAEMDYRDMIKLNNWEEINSLAPERPQNLCTSIGFKNTEFGPMMGKTTDIEVHQRKEYMLQWIYPETGNRFLHLGKVGTLKSEIGLNEKGLCIGTSSTMPTDLEGSQLERMTLVRLALKYCNDLDEAVDFFLKYKFYLLGLNILIMDSSGNSAVIEKGIANSQVRKTQSNYIFATNFFLCEDMKPHFDNAVWYCKNATARYENLQEIFNHYHGQYDFEFMKALLRNHKNEGGICNHNDNLDTFYASIILPRKLVLYMCDGRPCETEFEEYSLDKPSEICME